MHLTSFTRSSQFLFLSRRTHRSLNPLPSETTAWPVLLTDASVRDGAVRFLHDSAGFVGCCLALRRGRHRRRGHAKGRQHVLDARELGRIERFLQDSAGVVSSCFGVGRCTAPWSRGLHGVRISGRGDPEVAEGQWLAVLAVSVVIFRDDTRLFPYSARAPGRCDASARDADQFKGPRRVLLVNGIARY